MPLYIKALGYDANNNLVSCHGGRQVWEFRDPRVFVKTGPSRIGLFRHVQNGTPQTVYVTADPVIVQPGGAPCRAGALHARRVRDLPHWLGLAYAIVEMPKAFAHQNKVYGYSQRIMRIADFDALQMLEDFAQWCATCGDRYTNWAAADFIASRFPDGFLDGVER